MLEAVPARPLKPKTAAINAITKNVMAQLSITTPPIIKILNDAMTDFMSNRRATIGGGNTQMYFYITINVVLFMKRIILCRPANETSVTINNNK